jgi:hypothetical protein
LKQLSSHDLEDNSMVEESKDHELMGALFPEDDDDDDQIKDAGGPTITDKEFYKAMQKLKDRGTNAVPPKKSASAYILFGKEVTPYLSDLSPLLCVETNRDPQTEPHGQGHGSRERDRLVLEDPHQGRPAEVQGGRKER